MRIFDDGGKEVIEVTLRMQRKNFDVLVKMGEDDSSSLPCEGISIRFDQSSDMPLARLMVSSSPEQKEIQRTMGFEGGKVIER